MNPTSFHSNQCTNLHRVASIRNMKDQVYIDHIIHWSSFVFFHFRNRDKFIQIGKKHQMH